MNDPAALTTLEVARLARLALQQLNGIAWPINAPASWRRAVDDARGTLDELLMLCGMVEAVAAGIAVVVEQAETETDLDELLGAVLPEASCEPFLHGSLCKREECGCPCHTIPPHTDRHRR